MRRLSIGTTLVATFICATLATWTGDRPTDEKWLLEAGVFATITLLIGPFFFPYD